MILRKNRITRRNNRKLNTRMSKIMEILKQEFFLMISLTLYFFHQV